MFAREKLGYSPLPLPHRKILSDSERADEAKAFLEDMKTRHSVREFTNQEVPDQVIADCIATAGRAPSGANHQPWHFVAIKNPEVKSRIRKAAEEEEVEFYAGGGGDAFRRAIPARLTLFQTGVAGPIDPRPRPVKIKPQLAFVIPAVDQTPALAHLGELIGPVAKQIIGHDTRAELAGGFQQVLIGGNILVRDQHLIRRQAQHIGEIRVVLVPSRHAVPRVRVKHHTRRHALRQQQAHRLLNRLDGGRRPVPIHQVGAINQDVFLCRSRARTFAWLWRLTRFDRSFGCRLLAAHEPHHNDGKADDGDQQKINHERTLTQVGQSF